MTAPAINGTRYPQPVDELLPAARKLMQELGEVPPRNELMRQFHIGAPKAIELRARLVQPPATVVDEPTADPWDYAQPIGPDPLPAPVVPESVPLVEPDPTPVVTPVVAEPVEQVAPAGHPGTAAPLGPPPALNRRERRAVREQAAHDALMQGQTRRVREWTAKAAEARQLRRLLMDPDIQAVRLMRQRARWTAMAWSALLFALAFTMVNVQRFAAGQAEAWSPTWLVAWLVDPAFSILLVGLLIARGQLSAVGRSVDQRTVRRVEYALLASTAAMNVMPTLAEGYPGGWREQAMQVLLHLLIPGLAFASALVITLIQDHFAAAIAAITEGEDAR
ncbi:hypothetical protein F8271_24985 [Micromonospora sp. ALFpr18c]|uniref:hypothetical protein n=1 Tax=Micromonospora sp. ALFpr18c TaxID=1458665 RepID=UPI00124B96BC|nr:hypothetical protein [Micromonospora sp. ALFpr18c]KAB1932926.1 hypothetical protein F8271_24985 [Micromonospora sp. ALFpr18c]